MDKDYYLSKEEKEKKASSATRVLNFLVKYRDDFLEQKESGHSSIECQKFLKKELEANKDLAFDFFKRTATLKENISRAMNDLDLFFSQKVCDYLIDNGHRPMISREKDVVWISLDITRDGQTMDVGVLPTQSLYIQNCTEEVADKLYNHFMPDEKSNKEFDAKVFLNKLIDGKWAKSGLAKEKRVLLEETLKEYKGFHKPLAFKAEEIENKIYYAELMLQDFIHKTIDRIFKDAGCPAVFKLISDKEASFTMERQDDSLYDDKHGYSQKLEISKDGRVIWLDNVTEEIYNKILDSVVERNMPDQYYTDLMADVDKQLARIKEERGVEFAPDLS